MNWQKQWIDDVLAQIPRGRYRRRLEAELRDHLDMQRRALAEAGRTEDDARAEALHLMGAPEKLKAEYLAVWRRSWPGQLRQLGAGASAWFKSLIIMAGADIMGLIFAMILVLSDYNQIFLFVPAFFSLTLGAVYLRHKFQAWDASVCLVSIPLFVHWVLYCVANAWLYDFVEGWNKGFVEYLWQIRGLYLPGLAVCIVVTLLFGRVHEKKQKTAAA